MLARVFANIRSGIPVKYMLSPEHSQALRNYMAIASRIRQVPRLHTIAYPWGDIMEPYADNPMLREMWNSLMESHEPADLAAWLDLRGQPRPDHLMHESADFSGASDEDVLLHHLYDLHTRMSGGLNQQFEPQPAGHILTEYHPHVLAHPNVHRAVLDAMRARHGGGYTPAAVLGDLMRSTATPVSGHSTHPQHFELVNQYNNAFHGGDPLALVHLYDLAHNIATTGYGGPIARTHANRARERVHQALSTDVIDSMYQNRLG